MLEQLLTSAERLEVGSSLRGAHVDVEGRQTYNSTVQSHTLWQSLPRTCALTSGFAKKVSKEVDASFDMTFRS
jgi:hypothetical protein